MLLLEKSRVFLFNKYSNNTDNCLSMFVSIYIFMETLKLETLYVRSLNYILTFVVDNNFGRVKLFFEVCL